MVCEIYSRGLSDLSGRLDPRHGDPCVKPSIPLRRAAAKASRLSSLDRAEKVFIHPGSRKREFS